MDNHTLAGGLINCALFLFVVALAGIVDGNHIAVVLALGSAGVAVVDYSLRAASVTWPAVVLWLLSNTLAVAAAFMLWRGYFG